MDSLLVTPLQLSLRPCFYDRILIIIVSVVNNTRPPNNLLVFFSLVAISIVL